MIGERLKGWFASSSRFVAASARLAKKQAELAKLNNVTLPRLYHAIGKRIIDSPNLPPDLVPYREKIRELDAAIAAKPEEPKSQPASGFAAKAKQLAQQAASKTAKATADAGASIKIQSAYVALGRQTIEKYGSKSLPQDLRQQLDVAAQQREDLVNQIRATKGETSKQPMLSRRRLAVALTIACVVAGAVGFRLVPWRSRDESIAAHVDGQQGSRTEQPLARRNTHDDREPAEATVPKASSLPRRAGGEFFSGPTSLTDPQLLDVVEHAPGIKSLNLTSCKQLTDKCFEAIRQLPDLEELFLPDTPTITAAGLAVIVFSWLAFWT